MTHKISLGMISLVASGFATAGSGLYSVSQQPEDVLPLEYIAGISAIYDDNVSPGAGSKEDSYAVSPYIGAQLVNITPQSIVELYAKVGMNYYFEAPAGQDETSNDSRLSLDIYHTISERVSITSSNYIAYELEPNYAYGYASSRQSDEHYFYSTDQSIAYDWTPRVATRTGFSFTGVDYDNTANGDRETVQLYNQFRYLVSPQTIATLDYRYSTSNGSGVSSDSTNHFVLLGAEYRFSPNTIAITKLGAQFRDVDNGDSSSSPYAEVSFVSQINSQFYVTSFMRYSMEDYDTVQFADGELSEFGERKTLRIGAKADYELSPKLSLYGGVDYIPTSYEDGRSVAFGDSVSDQDEDVINSYVGVALKITETITGNLTYNYTNSDSDIQGRDYDRNRISLGVSATF